MDNRIDVASIRVSRDSQETDRQRRSITAAAERMGVTISRWFEDSEGLNSRDLAYKRKGFQEILRLVQVGQIRRVFVDAQDRFGTKNAHEWGKFMCLFSENDCKLYDSNCKELSANDTATIVTTAIGAVNSEAEQKSISARVVKKKPILAERGEYQGGNPLYGFDVVCVGPDGNEKWRTVYEGHFLRRQVFVDGREERYDGKDNSPKKALTDRLFLRPSIIAERVEYARKIFHWYVTESISPKAIADRLNDLKVNPVFGPAWYKQIISAILKNPDYMGRTHWGKMGKSRFFEQPKGAAGILEVPTKNGRPLVNRKRKLAEIYSPNEQQFDSFVTEENWQAAQVKLAASSSKHTHPSRPSRPSQVADLWLRSMLICGHCGAPMHNHKGGGKSKAKPSYFCGTYNVFGKKNKTGCGCHRIRHERLEKVILAYLAKVAPAAHEALAKAENEEPEALAPLHRELMELQASISGIKVDMMDAADGETYGEKLDQIRPQIEAQIAAKEEEFDTIFTTFATVKSDMARKKADAKMAALENEIKELRSLVIDLRQPLEHLQGEYRIATANLDRAMQTLSSESGARQKAAAVEKVINRIVCYFERTGKAGKRSKLVKVEIEPQVGEPRIIEESELELATNILSGSPPRRRYTYDVLYRVFSAEELAQIDPPKGTTRKNCKRHVPLEKLRENGRRAAAVKWSRAKATGQANSLTPQQRSELARKASAAAHSNQAAGTSKSAIYRQRRKAS